MEVIIIHVEWENGTRVAWRKWSGNTVTDRVKIKLRTEQMNRYRRCPSTYEPEFEAILLLLPKPVGYRTLQYWHGASARPQSMLYRKEVV